MATRLSSLVPSLVPVTYRVEPFPLAACSKTTALLRTSIEADRRNAVLVAPQKLPGERNRVPQKGRHLCAILAVQVVEACFLEPKVELSQCVECRISRRTYLIVSGEDQ